MIGIDDEKSLRRSRCLEPENAVKRRATVRPSRATDDHGVQSYAIVAASAVR